VAIIWVGIDRDELVAGHLSDRQQKLRNVPGWFELRMS
jgi:hypothetical protein